IGLGKTFSMIYSRYVLMIQVPFLTYSHNLLLQVWLSQGLTGILAFVWLIVAFFLFVWKTARQQSGTLFAGAWLGVAAILLHGLSDARQYADGWTLPSLFALLGLAVASRRGNSGKRGFDGTSRLRKVGGIAVVGILAAILVLARRPLTSMAYANAGALSQARGELTEGLANGQRSALLKEATRYYEEAIAMDQDNRTAHQRLGMLAMDARRFNEAVGHLEVAHQADPANTTTHKALGLAYTWVGHLDQAAQLLAEVPDIVKELNVWGWWRGTQGEHEQAANAYRVSLRLQPEQPLVQEALADMQED
ncbi:MAG: tetratricopeptide repeat protein, partial [bacterium]